eukprot:8826966-Heterocapsa_arctica.AAC.1
MFALKKIGIDKEEVGGDPHGGGVPKGGAGQHHCGDEVGGHGEEAGQPGELQRLISKGLQDDG